MRRWSSSLLRHSTTVANRAVALGLSRRRQRSAGERQGARALLCFLCNAYTLRTRMIAPTLPDSQVFSMQRNERIGPFLLTVLLLGGCQQTPDVPPVAEQRDAEFVGSDACLACHA